MKLALILLGLASCPSAFAAPTMCHTKIEMAAEGDLQLQDPNGGAYQATATLLTGVVDDSGALPEDKNLQLWEIEMKDANPKEGLPAFSEFAITRGEGFSACTLVKIIRR